MSEITCAVIRDLLPLYQDGVCSEESRRMIEEHLEGCPDCRREAAQLRRQELLPPEDSGMGELAAGSIRQMRRRLLLQRVITAVLAVVILLAGIWGSILWMQNSTHLVAYDSGKQNIQVSVENGELVARLYGSDRETVYARTIELEKKQILIFSMTASVWDELSMGENSCSFYSLTAHDEADEPKSVPDAVYYMEEAVNQYSYDELVELFAQGDPALIKLWEQP